MSKRPFKKFKGENSSRPTYDDYLEPLAEITNRSKSALRKYFSPEDVRGLTADQLRYLVKQLKNMSRNTWVDYLHFLLHPITSPRKVRIPGFISNPLGTEIRCFKNLLTFTTVAGTYDTKFCWSPGIWDFSKTSATKLQTNSFSIGQQRQPFTGTNGVPTLNDYAYQPMGVYWPDAVNTYFTNSRLLASECRINVIMNTLSAQGRVVISPVYVTNRQPFLAAASNLVDPAYINDPALSFVDKDIDDIFDNKIVHDAPVVEGARMVYLPVGQDNTDWVGIKSPSNGTTNDPMYNRMDYSGIFRGLPTGTKIEVYIVSYFEFTVNEKYYEIVASSENERPGVTLGTMNEVMASLQDMESIVPETMKYRGGDECKYLFF